MKSAKDIVLDIIDGDSQSFKILLKEILDSNNGISFKDDAMFLLLKESLLIEGYPENQLNQLIKNTVADISMELTLNSNDIKLPHNCKFKPLSEKQKKDEYMSVSAQCTQCKKYYGWRCKSSPDGVCHYYTSPRGQEVQLLNGEVDTHRFKTRDYDVEYETDDCCLYCGSPEERK